MRTSLTWELLEMFLTFFVTRWFVYHSSLESFRQPLKEGCVLETWNRVSQFRHRLKGVVSSVLKRTKLQCHLGHVKQLPPFGLWPLVPLVSVFFLGCVPSLVLVDLFRWLWRLERKEGVWRALRSRGGTSSFIWHCREVSNCGAATTVGVCVWRSD